MTKQDLKKNSSVITKEELQKEISEFYNGVVVYRDLLSKSYNQFVRIIKNHEELEKMRSDLSRGYGALSKYIKQIGNYPMRSDVGGGPYPVYEIAFSKDILQRRGPCIESVIQDLEYMVGVLDGISENEFSSLFIKEEVKNKKTLIFKIKNKFKKYLTQIVIGVIIIILGAIVVSYLKIQ